MLTKIPLYCPVKKDLVKLSKTEALGFKLIDKLMANVEKEYKQITKLFLSDLKEVITKEDTEKALNKETKQYEKIKNKLDPEKDFSFYVSLTELFINAHFRTLKDYLSNKKVRSRIMGHQLFYFMMWKSIFTHLCIITLIENKKYSEFFVPMTRETFIVSRITYSSAYMVINSVTKNTNYYSIYKIYTIISNISKLCESKIPFELKKELGNATEKFLKGEYF